MNYRHFEAVIAKAKTACTYSGQRVQDHFVGSDQMIEIGKGAQRAVSTVMMSRYACYQALTFFNNTDTTPNPIGYIEYDWNWSWQQRDRNEYNYDAHWAQGNGSTFWIHFNGTGVQFIGTYDGIVDFYIDEVFVKRVNMKDIGGMARCLGLDLRGLPPGNHTLKAVKVGDTYLLVDAFFVYIHLFASR